MRDRIWADRRLRTSSPRRSAVYERLLECLKAHRERVPVHVHAGRRRPRGERRTWTRKDRRIPGRANSDASPTRPLNDRPFSWRFRVPPGMVEWDDLFLGRVARDPARSGGDFIVARNLFGYSYQLAVVADDAAMGVNQVIRGDDLVPSTPRQILIYRQASWPEPRFGHVSLAVDSEGRRLAKRDDSLKLAALRENGVDPRAFIGALVHSCGWTKAAKPMCPREAIGLFDPITLDRAPWVVKREWLVEHGGKGPLGDTSSS